MQERKRKRVFCHSLTLSSPLQTSHVNKPCSGVDEWNLALFRAWDRTPEIQSSTSFKPTPSPSPLEREHGEKKWDNPTPPLCSLHEPVSPESFRSLIKDSLDVNFLSDPYIWPPHLLENISPRLNLSFKICGLSPILILSLSPTLNGCRKAASHKSSAFLPVQYCISNL